MHNLNDINEQLRKLHVHHAQRVLDNGGFTESSCKPLIDLSSNDYLNLSRNSGVITAAERCLLDVGVGARASRLVSGNHPSHVRLEEELAAHSGYPASLLFGSGYLANIGVLSALCTRGGTVISDRLIHASLVDGIRLSQARHLRFHHNDLDHLEELLRRERAGSRPLTIVTESLFSMDGDESPLPEIVQLAREYNALLIVDDAHAFGVFGQSGVGRVGELGLQGEVDCTLGTLSKSCGAYGGFVLTSPEICRLLTARARTLIYSTGLPPLLAASGLTALRIIQREATLGTTLLQQAAEFRELLRCAGFSIERSTSQIIPIVVGENEPTLRFAEALRSRGIQAVAIRPPTVPPGTARIRLSVTLAHTPELLKAVAEEVISVAEEHHIL